MITSAQACRTSSRIARSGEMVALNTINPASVNSLAAAPIRRIFSFLAMSSILSWFVALYAALKRCISSVK